MLVLKCKKGSLRDVHKSSNALIADEFDTTPVDHRRTSRDLREFRFLVEDQDNGVLGMRRRTRCQITNNQ